VRSEELVFRCVVQQGAPFKVRVFDDYIMRDGDGVYDFRMFGQDGTFVMLTLQTNSRDQTGYFKL
jgi:hypothetical protein